MGIIPDLINPGVFDPGEEMELIVRLNASELSGYSSIKWLLVTTPNGVKASWYFKG